MNEEIKYTPFSIKHMDSLGQGVSKLSKTVTFIPKTLPGEQGNCIVYQSTRSVQFARVGEIHNFAKERINAVCSHYDQCTGCHYLHTSYQNELLLKKQAMAFTIKKLTPQMAPGLNIQVHGASKRLEYRNRIQLHYDLKTDSLGLMSPVGGKILSVPDCKLGLPQIQEQVAKLYQNQHWKKLVSAPRGHIELYYSQKKGVTISVNKNYAHGGFTQVNLEMGEKAANLIASSLAVRPHAEGNALELFGGNGGLSRKLAYKKIYIVDSSPRSQKTFGQQQEYIKTNLYDKNSQALIAKKIKGPMDLLLLDPPRSGFKELWQWAEAFRPKKLVYMSCHTATLVRDLEKLKDDYIIKEVHLLDFFPSTYHFEALFFLGKKEQ